MNDDDRVVQASTRECCRESVGYHTRHRDTACLNEHKAVPLMRPAVPVRPPVPCRHPK